MASTGKCPPSDLGYVDRNGVQICRAFQIARCNNEQGMGGCFSRGIWKRHICAVLRSVCPVELCGLNHAAIHCMFYQGRNRDGQ